MMKTLLLSIDAKYIHTNNAVRLLKANSSFPVTILEYTIKDDISQIIAAIKEYQPDVIGCSVYIWNVFLFEHLLNDSLFKDIFVILGGPEVSYDAATFLQWPHVDLIVRGEGEHTFEQLLQRLNNHQPFDDLFGIAYQKEQDVIVKPIVEITDLSTIKMGHFFPEDLPHIPHKITYVESSRGCPYHCSYCLSSLEKTVRFFPLDTVKTVILHAMTNGSKTIKFLDRTFNANRNTLDIIDYIINIDNNKTVFQFEITGDVLPMQLIDYINNVARPGLFRFEIGIQSTNNQTNQLVDRHQNTEALFERIKRIQDAGIIDLHLDLIAGLPLEDKTSFITTFNQVFKLGAKELQLGFLKMLRGTKIRNEAALYDYVFDTKSPYEIQSNNVLSKEDIIEIKSVEHMLEIYHNKGYFGENLLHYMLQLESPYHFFYDLAQHYKTHHYPMHGYQLEDVYKHLFDLLDEDTVFTIKQDYLRRFTIKPKIFFDNVVDKKRRNNILTELSTSHNIPLHLLYKHAIVLVHKDEYFCCYYHQHQAVPFKGKALY